MTMHLVGPYMTTTNYKKRKQKKLTDNQQVKLQQEWRAYNKRMRQMNCHSAQFDEFDDYVAYTRGQYKPKVQKSVKLEEYRPQKSANPRETQSYPKLSNNVAGFAPKKESTRYTGDLIVGIATMHKSNLVPVMRGTDQAKDIAQMRRN